MEKKKGREGKKEKTLNGERRKRPWGMKGNNVSVNHARVLSEGGNGNTTKKKER